MNSGICTVNTNTGGFTCTCLGGFTGLFCENSSPSNPCSSSPCGVSGTCQVSCQSPLAYTCQCFSGFSGRNCETRKYWIRSNHLRIDFRVFLFHSSKKVCAIIKHNAIMPELAASWTQAIILNVIAHALTYLQETRAPHVSFF